MFSRFSLLLGGVLFVLSMQTWAHHGWSGQETRQSEISGTVKTPVSLSGPHATMQIVDEDGQLWDVTLAPPARTKRAGLTEDAIPVGAKVTIVGNRNSDPKRFEMKTVRVTYDGKNFDVYPDRIS
jgi:hypothetical protein